MAKTILVSITGPSGFDKHNLLKRLVESNEEYIAVPSYTDRPQKSDEANGVDFNFVKDIDFNEMVSNEEFVEWQKLPSNNFRYGKTKKSLQEALDTHKGKAILTRINIINLPVFKRYYPNSVSIFVDVKDSIVLVDILKESPLVTSDEEFERLHKFATEERRRRHLADFIISLKNIDETIEQINKIIGQFRS